MSTWARVRYKWKSATKACFAVLLLLTIGGQTPAARSQTGAGYIPPTGAASQPKAVSPDSYAGDKACASCHREKAEEHMRTAHHLTSRLANEHTIAGKFGPGANVLKTSNPELFFRMDAKEEGYFQTAVEGIPPYLTVRSERFDFVIGSGRKGQTYLFWKGDDLFELPVSFWSELGEWANSPGYPDGTANFNRPIIPRCLECHATSFESRPPPQNRFSKTGYVLGISCEKCHGPGREHVVRHNSKSVVVLQEGLVNPTKLPRDKQIDLCAWCHAGQGRLLAPAFSYLPGERLDNYLELPRPDPMVKVDVHGSQV